MASFKLNLRISDIKKNLDVPIYIIATDGKPYYINLKVFCKKWDWDFKQNKPKDFEFNEFCQKKIKAIHNEYLKNGFNVKRFKQIVANNGSFLEFAKQIEADIKKTSVGNAAAYKVAINSYSKFMGGDILFSDINPAKIAEYKEWCRIQGLVVNSQSFYLRTLKAIWRRHSKTSNPFDGLMPQSTRTEKRTLQEQGLLQFLRYKSNNKINQVAVDKFNLMFYMCGVNYLDLFYAEKDQLQGDYFVFSRKKLGERGNVTKIWVSDLAMKLLNKYKGKNMLLNFSEEVNFESTNYRSSLRRLNNRLKMIGNKLELGRITTNVARHSFATIARNKGVPLDIIKMLLSHTDNSVTGIYLGDYPKDILIENIKKATLL